MNPEVLLQSLNTILAELARGKREKSWETIADAVNRLYGTRDNLEALIEESKG